MLKQMTTISCTYTIGKQKEKNNIKQTKQPYAKKYIEHGNANTKENWEALIVYEN